MAENSQSTPSNTKRKINIILTIILFAVIFLFFWKSDAKSVQLEFQDTALTLAAPTDDAFSIAIPYGSILSIDFTSQLDLGSCSHGTDLDTRKNGIWHNAAYGDYTLCVYANVPAYIILHTTDGAVVFNYESENTTQQLYEALLSYVETAGADS